MAKTYVEPGRAALTGAFVSRKGAASYGEFYSDRRPDADDDETQGFAEGSIWHYVDRQRVYICVDPTPEAAVWRDLRDAAKVTIICRNNTGSTITKGSIVYVTGATGNRPTIALADKDSENTSSRTLGMVVSDIANGADGSVAVNGTVDDLNTAAYAAGTPLWLGDNGALTATVPTPPAHSVFIGWVAVSSANNGRIILHIQNGYELEELHDVLITTPTNNDVLTYETSSGLWKNKPVSSPSGVVKVLQTFHTDETATDETVGLYSYTVLANTLDTNGDVLRLRFSGDFLGFTDPLWNVFIEFGGVSVKASSTDLTESGVWILDVDVARVSNTSALVTSQLAWSGGTVHRSAIQTVSTGLDFTTNEDIILVGYANEYGTVTAKFGSIELLPKP
jgi:hypothetical protein